MGWKLLRRSALTLSVFAIAVGEPYSVFAQLHGGDRASFVRNFGDACQLNTGSERLVTTLGGASDELDQYCSCVANAYADRLSIETIHQLREIERLALADVSRRICLAEIFPTWVPDLPNVEFYPENADTTKQFFSWTTDAQSTLVVDVFGENRSAQIIVIDASSELFCWSEPLSVNHQILGSSPDEPVISALWCENHPSGYAEVFRISEEEFVVGFALEDGTTQWLVHEVGLEQQ
ncbi:hypothetical protein [Nioella aestuarii]|uniref:hypothetical protein n=1 Tax=Nioella aestuarii TaxID=1662864 RepID=UPI003D7FB4A0